MRDIIFRGKAKGRNDWVEGSLIKVGDYCCILEPDCESYGETYLDAALGTIDGQAIPVIPESVGQYPGLTDANGKRIFEGDILKTRRYETYAEELKGYCGYDKDGYPNKVPGYTGSMTVYRNGANDNYHAVVRFNPRHGYYAEGASVIVDAIRNTVVGNIYDNPELLER